MKKITFVFNEGRKIRLENEPNGPKEFFYTYNLFKNEYPETNLIEMLPRSNFFINTIFKTIRKFTGLPIYTDKLLTFKNLRIIFKSDIVVATNQNIGYSLIPLILIKKIFFKVEYYVITMGILENLNQKFFNNFLVKLLIKSTTKLLFISKSELDQSLIVFPEQSFKYLYVPFGIDLDFWKSDISKLTEKKILFIGNDKFRDYKFLLKLAKKMEDFQFTFLTNNILNSDLKNVSILNGSWKGKELSDEDVKNLYQNHHITIVPLIESMQPSGQSVTLQSICASTPVLITNTIGFWDKDAFENNKHIIFLDENDIEKWKKTIHDLTADKEKYQLIVTEAINLIKEKFLIDSLYKELKRIFNV